MQGLKVVSFMGPLAQMVDRDSACAKEVLAMCAGLAVEVAGGAGGPSEHKKVRDGRVVRRLPEIDEL